MPKELFINGFEALGTDEMRSVDGGVGIELLLVGGLAIAAVAAVAVVVVGGALLLGGLGGSGSCVGGYIPGCGGGYGGGKC